MTCWKNSILLGGRHFSLTILLLVALGISVTRPLPAFSQGVILGGTVKPYKCAGDGEKVSVIQVAGAVHGIAGDTNYVDCVLSNDGRRDLTQFVGYTYDNFPTNERGETIVTQNGSPFIDFFIRQQGFTIDPRNIVFKFCIKPNPNSDQIVVKYRSLQEFGSPNEVDGDLRWAEVGRNIFRGPGNFDLKKVTILMRGRGGRATLGRLQIPVQLNGLSVLEPRVLTLTPGGCEDFLRCP